MTESQGKQWTLFILGGVFCALGVVLFRWSHVILPTGLGGVASMGGLALALAGLMFIALGYRNRIRARAAGQERK